MSFLQNSDDPMKAAERPRGPPQNSSSDVLKIIRTVKERDMLPCIIFSFSRKECESYAAILKGVDFNTGKGFINYVFSFVLLGDYF